MKIAEETRKQIISMYGNGRLQREIREETGVSMASISRIVREAGLDKFHVGSGIAKSVQLAPSELPKAADKPGEPVAITGKTLNLHGQTTGCDYVAGTHMQTVDITLGDWMLSIDCNKIGGFIAEMEYIRKMIGAR